MNKKLIAVAVAGAFAAPAVALAQTSTVQIYGKITYEYARIDQGTGRINTDYADTPGGTSIGFKGEEKLGGGLSAWFQCESSADVRGIDQTGLCTRNSAVGFKGGFGNIYFGRWDTPMKKALNVGSTGAQETGSFGASFMAFGGSGGTDSISGTFASNRNRWKRREVAMTNYDSPNFGGFQVFAAISPGNHSADYDMAAGTPNPKPRVVSLAGVYKAGKLGIGVGYERHQDFRSGLADQGDDKALGVSAKYGFGKFAIGATYLDARYDMAGSQELKKKTFTVGAEIELSGPHGIELGYTNAGDSKGNSTTAISDLAASGPETGGQQYSVAYVHKFSKRTEGRLIYTRISNDNNASYKLGSAGGVAAGESQSAFGFHVGHRF